jgi:ABC-type polysaccharide/polyol phosphate export permease
MHLGVFIEDMANVVNIVLRFIFYLTGIFYNIKANFPEPYVTILLKCNPLAAFINGLRDCVMYRSIPDVPVFAAWLAISLVLSVFGVWNIYKNENTYVKVI